MKKPVIHVSNSGEKLIALLRAHLFCSNSPLFSRKFIILPDIGSKNLLMTRFLSDTTLDVVMGVEWLELGAAIQSLFKCMTGKTLLFPPQDLLALQIEAFMENESPAFATALASEFLKYGKFGGSTLSGWQKEIWDRLFGHWNYPYELLESSVAQRPLDLEVHVFNFPFLPKLYHLFFEKVAACCPVHYYQFSPCQEFWSDTVTAREKERLVKQDPRIASYLDSGSSLLSNFGTLGRATFRVFEEEDFILDEHYSEITAQTALTTIQHSILHFEPVSYKQDASIRLNPASSKLREVELLHQALLDLNACPSDVHVFAADMNQYASAIEHVFGAEDSPFAYSIRDIAGHSFLESFFLIFSLGRFEVEPIFRLLESPYFSPLTDKEVHLFRSWVNQTGIKWGMDATHRRHLLPGYLEEDESGTWEQAFTYLLDNLIHLPEAPSTWDLPYIDFSDAEVLGRCIVLMRQLRNDLEELEKGSFSFLEWADHLERLFLYYFDIPEDEASSYQRFEEKLQMLRELGKIHEAPQPFDRLKRYLAAALKEKRGSRQSRQVEVVTFRSLKLGAIFSSKVIALLGMSEGAFPRPYVRSSLSLLDARSDFSPYPADEDRYLFLEALMSAQETLLVSYQNISEEDGKEQPPSLLVQELDLQPEIQPPFPFHSHYFRLGNHSSMRHYEWAQAFYNPKTPLPFIPEFTHQTPLPHVSKDTLVVDVAHLVRFAKHPIRFYCNHTLRLYFPYEDTTDEEFQLSSLKRYQLFQETFQEAQNKGHLPLGRFKQVAMRRIEEEMPPETLVVDFHLEHFHVQGLLEVPDSDTLKMMDRVRTYPLTLICDERHELLLRYLNYYQISLQSPSPFHPLLAEALLKQDATTLGKKLQTVADDPYLERAFSHCCPQSIIDTWSPVLQATFEELI